MATMGIKGLTKHEHCVGFVSYGSLKPMLIFVFVLFSVVLKLVVNYFISFICPECTKTNNSEQIVGQDSKATQDALITARINYKPNENNRNTIKTQSKRNSATVCPFDIRWYCGETAKGIIDLRNSISLGIATLLSLSESLYGMLSTNGYKFIAIFDQEVAV